jgi:hypothetical protein
MAASVDLTALTTNLGAYARENKNQLFADTLLGFNNLMEDTGVTLWDDVQDEVPLPNLTTASVVRRGDYQNFSPTNNALIINNRMLKARPFKVDLRIYPQDFLRNWLALNRPTKGTPTEFQHIPFHEFLMQKILEQIQDELRLITYKGVFNGAGSTNIDVVDGFIRTIKNGITATTVPTVALGNITQANVVGKLEELAFSLGDAYANKKAYLHVPRKIYEFYITADPTATGRHMMFNEVPAKTGADVYLRGTNVKLVRNIDLRYGTTNSELFVTTENNLFIGTDTLNQLNGMEFEKEKRWINMMMDGVWGVNYALDGATRKCLVASEGF